jgi:hypothetical protein
MNEWKLTPASCHEVKCCNCGWETSEEGTTQQAVAELKRLGWELKSDGPWCPECVLQDELSKDDSPIYPKGGGAA